MTNYMPVQEFNDYSIRKLNYNYIAQDKDCQALLDEMRKIEKFLSDFGYLSFGRDLVLCRQYSFSLNTAATACELTAGSVISCCESGCMADAFSLLRKYRDDLFFYLFIQVYNASEKTENQSKNTKNMENSILRWIKNDLCNLNIGTVMKAIGQSPQVMDAAQKYNLQQYFDTINARLNNYVHSNGISFYNRNINAYPENGLKKQMQLLLKDMRFITISFLFLLTLCSPLSIMSTDYVDYLDCNMIPPEGSQYWVAPFVEEFFRNNIDLIDKNCMDYLKENTNMEFKPFRIGNQRRPIPGMF